MYSSTSAMKIFWHRKNVYTTIVIVSTVTLLCYFYLPGNEEPLLDQYEFYSALFNQYKGVRDIDKMCSSDSYKTCFAIQDILVEVNRSAAERYVVQRYIAISSLENAYLSSIELKVPPFKLSNIDSTKWEVRKNFFHHDDYSKIIMASIFQWGVVPLGRDFHANILQIGLGGGAMNNFISSSFPNVNLTVVDLDPLMYEIAKKWFQLKESDRHRVLIRDGVQVIEEAASQGLHYDVIVIDACSNGDVGTKTLCPVAPFLAKKTLKNVRNLIGNNGIVVYNLLPSLKLNSTRDEHTKIAQEVLSLHNEVFPYCELDDSYDKMYLNFYLACSAHSRTANQVDVLQEAFALFDEIAQD